MRKKASWNLLDPGCEELVKKKRQSSEDTGCCPFGKDSEIMIIISLSLKIIHRKYFLCMVQDHTGRFLRCAIYHSAEWCRITP